MGFGEGVGDDLVRETNADSSGVRSCSGEDSVIESTAAAEATAAGIEGETGAEEGVDLSDLDFGQGGGGFTDSEGARNEIVCGIDDGVKSESVAIDPRIDPAVVGMAGDEIG